MYIFNNSFLVRLTLWTERNNFSTATSLHVSGIHKVMHQILKRHSATFSLLLIAAGLSFMQWHAVNVECKDLRNGRFHYYGKQSEVHFLILRQDSIQKEVNVATNDTSYWRVAWIDDCTYTANYLSGGGMKSEEEKSFLRSHTTIMQIQKTTADYYIVKGALDSLNSRMNVEDTVWMRAK